MSKPPTILNTILSTLAPAHARRKRSCKTQTVRFDFFSETAAPEPKATRAQLQAAYAARCADEMRSAF